MSTALLRAWAEPVTATVTAALPSAEPTRMMTPSGSCFLNSSAMGRRSLPPTPSMTRASTFTPAISSGPAAAAPPPPPMASWRLASASSFSRRRPEICRASTRAATSATGTLNCSASDLATPACSSR